ncbi:MAG: phosphoribosylaminoimidazolesuccinocarboxamide synthase [Planctomycetota bacterium]
MPTANPNTLTATHLNLPDARSGKVRDTFTLPPAAPGGAPRMLIVATDRVSAFDVVLPTPIPGKGRILNALAAFWLRRIESRGIVRTHLLSTDHADIPDAAFRALWDGTEATTPAALAGRVTIGRACRVIPVECVVRGYLEGSGLKEYRETGRVCGVELPAGLTQCDRLPEPIFTPATKAEGGEHDENISFERTVAVIEKRFGANTGGDIARFVRDRSLAAYHDAHDHAHARGVILADTKFEFGLPLGPGNEPILGAEPIMIDEALTPDSSRYWQLDRYEPGRAQPSYDKQFVREHLESLVERGRWDKAPPGPDLPPQIVEQMLARYNAAVRALTA